MPQQTDNIILGIDPGTTVMGYGVIHNKNKNIQVLAIGVLELYKFDDHFVKIKKIFDRTKALIEQYNPDTLAIEAQFYGKNIQSMLKLGRAQGAAITAALSHSIPIAEYAPKKIKQSITGNGNASKEQIAAMLKAMYKIEIPEKLDATDGLAVAVCHLLQKGKSDTKSSSWKRYISENPNKVKY